jgi:hypothetical protein
MMTTILCDVSFGPIQMTRTMDYCVDRLADLSAYSELVIDATVDSYLVGFGEQTAGKRLELAEAFRQRVAVSELAERIQQRILRVT